MVSFSSPNDTLSYCFIFSIPWCCDVHMYQQQSRPWDFFSFLKHPWLMLRYRSVTKALAQVDLLLVQHPGALGL